VGGNFVRLVLKERPDWHVTVFDHLGGRDNVPVLEGLSRTYPGRYRLVRGRITDVGLLDGLFAEGAFDTVVHFAAKNPSGQQVPEPFSFVEVNVLGTAVLLEAARKAWEGRSGKFLHLGSYEVYGSDAVGLFTELSPLDPSTPYAATKAAADEITLAYHSTFGLHTLVTRTTNIYGPYQSGDKLIPAMIALARDSQEMPVYGSGRNLRDWIHVDDHNRGVLMVLERGRAGEVYHLGGRCERTNLDVVKAVGRNVYEYLGKDPGSAQDLIRLVEDREAHDARRALDPSKAERELGFEALIPFETGLRDTVRWFLDLAECGAPHPAG
jgi:dTDP-glucose 4,6-dehydratase